MSKRPSNRRWRWSSRPTHTPFQHHNAMELFAATALWAGDRLTRVDAVAIGHHRTGRCGGRLWPGADRCRGDLAVRWRCLRFESWFAALCAADHRRGARCTGAGAADGDPARHVHRGHLQARIEPEVSSGSRPRRQTDGLRAHRNRADLAFRRCGQPWDAHYAVDVCLPQHPHPNSALPVPTPIRAVSCARRTRPRPSSRWNRHMDELALALAMDPVELRRVNDARNHPVTGVPFSSRSLMPCYDAAAKSTSAGRRAAWRRVRCRTVTGWSVMAAPRRPIRLRWHRRRRASSCMATAPRGSNWQRTMSAPGLTPSWVRSQRHGSGCRWLRWRC